MLIEVLVSALLVALISVGIFTGLAGANHASVNERRNAQATVIAQQDEERLRGLPVEELTQIGSTTHTVAENGMCVEGSTGAYKYWSGAATFSCEALTAPLKGTTYTGSVFTVKSSAEYVTASKETLTCETTNGTADYIETTSSVEWPSIGTHAPIGQSSLVAVPRSGTLMVKVKNSKAEAVSGATVAVTDGTVTAEQTTPSSGCVIFGDLPEGTAKVLASKAGWIERTGKAAPEKTTSITAKSLAEVEFMIEDSGGIEATFVNSTGKTVEGSTFVAFQTEMGSPAFAVGGKATSEPATTAKLEGLYPFASDYKVYAGDCEANKPAFVGVSGAKEESVPVLPGEENKPARVEVAPVTATVDEGISSLHGSPLTTNLQTAMIINTECSTASPASYEHKVTLNSSGEIEQKYQYQPFAKKLEFCVVALISGKYYKYKSPMPFENKTGKSIGPIYIKEPVSASLGYSGASNPKLTCP
jgi:type II secretory pathway pseudopilin PulG